MIYFTVPSISEQEIDAVNRAMDGRSLSGNGYFAELCLELLSDILSSNQVLLTDSCTGALEMIALDLGLVPGDEVIVPAYTFVSSALPFSNYGAKIVFCDINSGNWNLNWDDVWSKVTSKTKAIVVVHYGGVPAIDQLNLEKAKAAGIKIIEDAAQAIGCFDESGNHLGTLGDYGTISFHSTKNITSGGEGGCLIVKDAEVFQRMKFCQEKGTDRSLFLAGIKDKYSWVSVGRSALMSELQAAFLSAQLRRINEINNRRQELWEVYFNALHDISPKFKIPSASDLGNGHVFCIELSERDRFIKKMHDVGIVTPFHYSPLNLSKFSIDNGWSVNCPVAEDRAGKNVRLPLHHGLAHDDQLLVINYVMEFSSC